MKRKELMKELSGLSVDDLAGRARSMAEELMKLRFRKTSGQLEQSHHVGVLKRNLARAKTLLAEKASTQTSAKAAGASK